MSDRSSECIRNVIAMIPMPVSHVAEYYAERYCMWGVPADVVAMAILELLLGRGKADWEHEFPTDNQLDIGRALAEGREGIARLQQAAANLNVSQRMAVWKDICTHFDSSPSLSKEEIRSIYFQVLKGEIKNVADAIVALSKLRADSSNAPTPKLSNGVKNKAIPD